jgi:hypothetical protein
MELLSGLVGALVGGLLAMAASALQARFQTRHLERQFEHQRQLAEEDHDRKQVVIENERLRAKVEAQIAYGRRVMVAAARFQLFATTSGAHEQLTKALGQAVAFAGLNWDAPAPYPDFLQREEMEDAELRDLVCRHGEIVNGVDMALMFADAEPGRLPPDCPAVLGEVDGLARQIGQRCRLLQRRGQPL